MDIHEQARAAKLLRDDKTFQSVISGIEQRLAKTLLDANASDEAVAEARQKVVGLAAIQREIRAQIDAPLTAGKKKGQHRGSD